MRSMPKLNQARYRRTRALEVFPSVAEAFHQHGSHKIIFPFALLFLSCETQEHEK